MNKFNKQLIAAFAVATGLSVVSINALSASTAEVDLPTPPPGPFGVKLPIAEKTGEAVTVQLADDTQVAGNGENVDLAPSVQVAPPPSPSVSIEAPAPKMPEVSVDAVIPTVKVETPKVQVPDVEVKVEAPKVQVPDVEVKVEAPKVQVPDVEVKVEAPAPVVPSTKAEMAAPAPIMPEINANAAPILPATASTPAMKIEEITVEIEGPSSKQQLVYPQQDMAQKAAVSMPMNYGMGAYNMPSMAMPNYPQQMQAQMQQMYQKQMMKQMFKMQQRMMQGQTQLIAVQTPQGIQMMPMPVMPMMPMGNVPAMPSNPSANGDMVAK